MITNDPTTWPSGDSIWEVCHAIATAEGAYKAGSNPDRLNNPGDLSDGAALFGSEHHSGSDVTKFPSKEIGWQYLYEKIQRIQEGHSKVYSASMTWTQIAQKWAGDWQDWVKNVCNYLGVDQDSTFGDYFENPTSENSGAGGGEG